MFSLFCEAGCTTDGKVCGNTSHTARINMKDYCCERGVMTLDFDHQTLACYCDDVVREDRQPYSFQKEGCCTYLWSVPLDAAPAAQQTTQTTFAFRHFSSVGDIPEFTDALVQGASIQFRNQAQGSIIALAMHCDTDESSLTVSVRVEGAMEVWDAFPEACKRLYWTATNVDRSTATRVFMNMTLGAHRDV